MTAAAAQTTEKPQARHQVKEGIVISNKMDKTIVVQVVTLKRHRIYKRTYKHTKHFYAHDENNVCKIGDSVLIEETRPLSKLKRWNLVKVTKLGSGIVSVAEVLAEADPDLSSESADA